MTTQTNGTCPVAGCDNAVPPTGGLYVTHIRGDFEGSPRIAQDLVCDDHARAIQEDQDRFDATYGASNE